MTLLDILQDEKANKYSGGIYHKTQIDLTYNSNHIEGSRLTHEQTRYIFETNTIGVENEVLNVDDVIETANHFRCIDMIIDHAKATLTEKFIKELHLILKNGTSDSRKDWFAVGAYKKLPNEVGGMDTTLPEEVADRIKELLTEYNRKEHKTFEDILDFHVKFEQIHPFQDGNGRMSRLLTLLLLYQNDYIVGKSISLEKLIEDTKDSYYDALQESSQGWMEDENNYEPFSKYILGIITAAYREFFDRAQIVEEKKVSKPDRIEELIKNHLGTITKAEIVDATPGISTTTVQRTLTELVKAEKIIKIGNGRYTKYKWNWDKEI